MSSSIGPSRFGADDSERNDADLLSRLGRSLAADPVSSYAAEPDASTTFGQLDVRTTQASASRSRAQPIEVIRFAAESETDSYDDSVKQAPAPSASSKAPLVEAGAGRKVAGPATTAKAGASSATHQLPPSSRRGGGGGSSDPNAAPEEQSLLSGPQLQEQEEAEDFDYDEELSIAADFAHQQALDRGQRIAVVARDTSSMFSMFQEISTLVASAGGLLDDLESTIEGVHEGAKESAKELDKANRYMKAKRQRMCCLICCLAIVLVVLVFFLTITGRKRKHA